MTDASNTVTEKYLTLPGGVLLTIRPAQTGNAQKTYNLPNIHGDIFATTDASGVQTGTTLTGPFGEPISGQTSPNNTATNSTYGWVGQNEKLNETSFTSAPIQMGARVYLPSVGRFLQMDPVEGGTDNNYAYVNDPVNESDLSGNCINQYYSMCLTIINAIAEALTVAVESYGGVGGGSGAYLSVGAKAEAISKELGGKNSFSAKTTKGITYYDLKGASHYNKSTGVRVPTPHVQERTINNGYYGNKGNARIMTHQDIRILRKAMQKRGR